MGSEAEVDCALGASKTWLFEGSLPEAWSVLPDADVAAEPWEVSELVPLVPPPQAASSKDSRMRAAIGNLSLPAKSAKPFVFFSD